jgi:hypothetical protein
MQHALMAFSVLWFGTLGLVLLLVPEQLRAGSDSFQQWDPYALPNWMLRAIGLLIIALDVLIASEF